MKKRAEFSTAGFSMVEVSLALLVIGLGLLVVFSLFPAGLGMNKNSIDETQCALFANDVFDAYRAKLVADPNLWSKMGTGSAPGLEPTAKSMWKNGATIRAVTESDPFVTLVYTNLAGRAENAWRYRLTLGDVSGRERVKFARLQVLHGEYGPTNYPVEFYTEYYNFRSPRYP